MRACAFPECRRRPKSVVKIYLHRFPVEEPIRNRWISWIREDCGLANFQYHKYSSLCHRHFKEDCIRESGRLKPDSYPSITPEMLDDIPKSNIAQLSCSGQMDKVNQLGGGEALEMTFEHDPLCIASAEPSVSHRTKRKAYAADLTPDDFSTPQKAKRHFQIMRSILNKSNARAQMLRKKYAAAMKKIHRLQCHLACLKYKKPLSSDSCPDP